MRGLIYFIAAFCLCLAGESLRAAEIKPAALPKELVARHMAYTNCIELKKDKLPQAIESDKLSETTTLYIIPCFYGAYNIFSKVYLVSGDELEQAFFADYSSELGWIGADMLVNLGYDPKTKTLHSFNKSAGHGGCGSAGSWRWKDYGFQMIRLQSWDKCEESKAPEDWPYIYGKEE